MGTPVKYWYSPSQFGSVGPGATALTVMPVCASSSAHVLVKLTKPLCGRISSSLGDADGEAADINDTAPSIRSHSGQRCLHGPNGRM